MQFRAKLQEDPRVDLTPLIDCVLFLVLFFAVTWSVMAFPGLKLNLPSASTSATVTTSDKIEVQMTEAGDLYVAGNPVPESGLGPALRSGASDTESSVVVLMADRSVTHGQVIKIIDVIRQVGFKRVVLAARNKSEPDRSAHN